MACMIFLISRPQVENADKASRETFLSEVLVGDANEGAPKDSERQEHIKTAINTGEPCSDCIVEYRALLSNTGCSALGHESLLPCHAACILAKSAWRLVCTWCWTSLCWHMTPCVAAV